MSELLTQNATLLAIHNPGTKTQSVTLSQLKTLATGGGFSPKRPRYHVVTLPIL